MAYLTKHRKKWQARVRKKNFNVSKSFWKKSDASKWALKVEAHIETGSYNRVVEAERIADITQLEIKTVGLNVRI